MDKKEKHFNYKEICTINGEVEAAQAVPSQRICSTLKNYHTWLISFNNLGYNLHNGHWQAKVLDSTQFNHKNKSINYINHELRYFTTTYSFEKSSKASVIYSILEWDIYGIKFSFSFSCFLQYITGQS